jgi:hypothetical protein
MKKKIYLLTVTIVCTILAVICYLVYSPPKTLEQSLSPPKIPETIKYDRGIPPKPDLKTIDISGDKSRQFLLAYNSNYQHPSTCLSKYGFFATWGIMHGGPSGPVIRTKDFNTIKYLPTPKKWHWTTGNCPTIFAMKYKDKENIVLFAPKTDRYLQHGGPMYSIISKDGGKTWDGPINTGLFCCVSMTGMVRLDNGDYLGFYHDMQGKYHNQGLQTVYQATSKDGGRTWKNVKAVAYKPGMGYCEPNAIKIKDTILVLLRCNWENTYYAKYIVSKDNGKTWSKPKNTPWGLTGDRHIIRQLPDGRLFVAFRDKAFKSNTNGQYVAWIGTLEDILTGKPGQYRVKLIHTKCGTGYSGVEILPDGTIICTTYTSLSKKDPKHSIIATRFKINELDKLAQDKINNVNP